MVTLHNNIVCVEAAWLYGEGKIMTLATYKNMKARGQLEVVQKGGNGRKALVDFESLRQDIKDKVVAQIGNPYKTAKKEDFESKIRPDHEAAEFYNAFKLPDGRNLPDKRIVEYRANAEILNAISILFNTSKGKRKALGRGGGKAWERVAEMVAGLDQAQYPHSLPGNHRRLKQRFVDYKKDGYLSLVHKGYCNENSRKVTADLERLILSLYVMPNKPYSRDVHEMYLQFLGRALEVVDYKTGELYDPDDFRNEAGEYIKVSEATVWNYLNMPHNRIVVDKFRAGQLEYISTARPHHHREPPNYTLSKISLDDRDLPRKMPDGKRVKAYYAYDVLSGAIIGAAYSKRKDTQLFIECMRDMFRNLNQMGLGIPLQPEVEHHLVNHYQDDLMKAGVVFPFVRWGNPGNAQEKYAETGHRLKKYGYEKRYQDGIGRFYSKLEANRTHQDKISDEDNDNYKERTYSFEQLVADDRAIVDKMNADRHPNQKRFPKKSRIEVLINYVNPDCADFNEFQIARYIGDSTETSLRRSQYVTVQHVKYQLPDIDLLSRLKPNNYKVTAYYLPEASGIINQVHLYQGDEYICSCERIEAYNTANAEWTDADQEAYKEQAKYVSAFDAKVKQRRSEIGRLKVARPEVQPEQDDTDEVEVVQLPSTDTQDDFSDCLTGYDADEYRRRATDSL